MFFHTFELSTIGVEAAVGNLVAPCGEPLFTRLSGLWLFFDQAFGKDFQRPLSSLLSTVQLGRKPLAQPVDKSVGKRWKDGCKRHVHRPWAITGNTSFLGADDLRSISRLLVKKNTCQSRRKARFAGFQLPPEFVQELVDKVSKECSRPYGSRAWRV